MSPEHIVKAFENELGRLKRTIVEMGGAASRQPLAHRPKGGTTSFEVVRPEGDGNKEVPT